jgi:hypothetical protein
VLVLLIVLVVVSLVLFVRSASMLILLDELFVRVIANLVDVLSIHIEVAALAGQGNVSVGMLGILMQRVDVRRRRSILKEVIHRRANTLG